LELHLLVESKKDSNAEIIIKSTDPMALRLHIISSKISSEKMIKGTRKGFVKSTGGNIEPIKSEIEQFLKAFSEDIKKGDMFEFVATEKGVRISKNNEQQQTVSSHAFKEALFGIWLSEKPVKTKLKKKLLGS